MRTHPFTRTDGFSRSASKSALILTRRGILAAMETSLSNGAQGRIVLSASRRTDIPAFFMAWFMERIKAGFFSVTNPYNRKTHIIPALPGQVAGIVFWSKNYAPFLKGGYGSKLIDMGFRLFFHFTVNSENSLLEPNLPPLSERLSQFGELTWLAGKDAVVWRFDPICHYTINGGPLLDNLGDFDAIAKACAQAGIGRCVTSFMDHYPKIKKRVGRFDGLALIEPAQAARVEILKDLDRRANSMGIGLFTCCEPESAIAAGVGQGACLDHGLLEKAWSERLSGASDTGQRREKGCLCQKSADVGDYSIHRCPHGCLYCYANPS